MPATQATAARTFQPSGRFRDTPVEKGDDDAVDCRQEGVFSRGGPLQAEGLEGIGQKEQGARGQSPHQVSPVQVPPGLPEHQAQDQGGGGEAEG